MVEEWHITFAALRWQGIEKQKINMSTQVDLFTNVEPTSVSPAIAKLPVIRSCCPSNDFTEGEPSGKCWGDGHYLCQSCKWYRADFKKYGQDYIDAAHNAQHGFGGLLMFPA